MGWFSKIKKSVKKVAKKVKVPSKITKAVKKSVSSVSRTVGTSIYKTARSVSVAGALSAYSKGGFTGLSRYAASKATKGLKSTIKATKASVKKQAVVLKTTAKSVASNKLKSAQKTLTTTAARYGIKPEIKTIRPMTPQRLAPVRNPVTPGVLTKTATPAVEAAKQKSWIEQIIEAIFGK